MHQATLSLSSASFTYKRMRIFDDPLMRIGMTNPPNQESTSSTPSEYEVFVKKHNKDHDWIYYDTLPGGSGSYCSLCREYVEQHNIQSNHFQLNFIKKPSKNLKSSALVDHAKCFNHREAYKLKYGSNAVNKEQGLQSLETFDTERASISDDDMLIHFLSVYFLSKEEIALKKFKTLTDIFKLCDLDFNMSYQNDKAAREILTCLSTKIKSDLMKEVCMSLYIGIMLDESTDVSSTQYLVVNIRYLFKNEVKEKFCALLELNKADADGILSVLLGFLTECHLVDKVAAISTDGAAVMMGKENGVAIKLKEYTQNKNIIINHCLSYRVNLGAKDVWANETSLVNFNSTIHSLCSFFSKSAKKTQILDEEQQTLLKSQLKLLKPIDIRWLSIYKVIERICEIYPALISSAEIIANSEGYVIAETLVSRLGSIHFVSLLNIFRDLMTYLDPLNFLFQKEHLTVAQAYRELDATIANLEEFSDSEEHGKYFHDFVESNKDNDPRIFLNRKLTQLYGVNIENMSNKSKKLQRTLLKHLKDRFPSQKDLQVFRIFDLATISTLSYISERKNFGVKEGKELLERYNFNINQGIIEWDKFKTYAFSNYKTDQERVWIFALDSPLFQNIKPLFQINLIIPLSTSACERTFSTMNLIKNELRNRMETDTLQHHLMISRNRPELKDIEGFHIEAAIQMWRDKKPRRFSIKKIKV